MEMHKPVRDWVLLSLTGQKRKLSAFKIVPSLEDLCIRLIVEEIEVYNSIYLSSRNITLKGNIDFIQRMYSSRLLSLLSDSKKLKESHLNFVINKYIKELDLNYLRSVSWKAALKLFIEIGSVLEKFVLGGITQSQFISSKEAIISQLTNLRILHIELCCCDYTLFLISKYCTNLRKLDIKGSSEISSRGLKYIANSVMGSTSLKELSIKDVPVMNDGFTLLLQKCSLLEVIEYEYFCAAIYSMHREDLERGTLNELRTYNLIKLGLPFPNGFDASDYSNILKICSVVCPHVKQLGVEIQNKEHLDLCSNFSEVERLTILGCIDNEHIDVNDYLQRCGSNLTSLRIRGFNLLIPNMAKNCSQLRELHMEDNYFQGIGDSVIFRFKYLVHISFFQNSINPRKFIYATKFILLSCSALEKLNFSCYEFSDSDFDDVILSSLKSLKQINFTHCILKIALLERILLALTSLESLTMVYCLGVDPKHEVHLLSISNSVDNHPVINSFGNNLTIGEDSIFDE